MADMSVFINFNGDCSEAIDFYCEAFGVQKGVVSHYRDIPASEGSMPAELGDLILYAEVSIGNANVMLSDVPPDQPVTSGNQVSITLDFDDEGAVRHAYEALGVGGTTVMELQPCFFAKLYAQIIDKYGVSWMLLFNAEQMAAQ